MKIEIEHFYYVAQANGGAKGENAYHVQVFDVAETMDDVVALGGQARRGRTLNMSQADAEGIDTRAIKAWIDADLAKRLDAANERIAELEALLEAKEPTDG